MGHDCIFCNIVNGQTDTQFLYENDNVVVFKDIKPHFKIHLLVVPKRHIRSINDLTDQDNEIVAELIRTAQHVAQQQGFAKDGYKLLFNVEKGGGQVIFHLHLHLLAGGRI